MMTSFEREDHLDAAVAVHRMEQQRKICVVCGRKTLTQKPLRYLDRIAKNMYNKGVFAVAAVRRKAQEKIYEE